MEQDKNKPVESGLTNEERIALNDKEQHKLREEHQKKLRESQQHLDASQDALKESDRKLSESRTDIHDRLIVHDKKKGDRFDQKDALDREKEAHDDLLKSQHEEMRTLRRKQADEKDENEA